MSLTPARCVASMSQLHGARLVCAGNAPFKLGVWRPLCPAKLPVGGRWEKAKLGTPLQLSLWFVDIQEVEEMFLF